MTDRQTTTFTIPVAPSSYAALTLNWPISAEEWDQLMRVIGAMKPGLIAGHAEASREARHSATEATEGIPKDTTE